MKHVSAREFARSFRPFRVKEGVIAMLSAYFDDSGTHGDSKFVVWAGVIGTDAEFDVLDAAWSAKLDKPFPGKPPLSKFSVGDCRWADGEFRDYKPAERDALRYEMREIIQNSGVRPVAYTVPVGTYNKIIRGRVRRAYGPPDGIAFAACADQAFRVAEANKLPLTCTFDKGQRRPWLNFLLEDADRRATDRGVKIGYAFGAVADHCGLQAADTIATEHYWYALEAGPVAGPLATMDPHFVSLIKMTKPTGYVFLEHDMVNLRDEFRKQFPLRDWFRKGGGRLKALPWPSDF
jgi:hypothetical protein